MIYMIIVILTACMAVFVAAMTIQVILAGYSIGWVMLICTLLISWILFTDKLDSMTE